MENTEDQFLDRNSVDNLPNLGSKRSLPTEQDAEGPPSPKRAGLEVTVHVDAPGESPSETKHTTKSPSPKKEAKIKDGSPKKIKQDPDESAEREAQRLKREKQAEDRMKMKVLVSNFTEDQLDRYEMFRRSAFPKAAVRRLMQSISGTTIPQNVVIAMAGIAKVYVGEIVEEALDVKEKVNEAGPIQPKHIRESVRKLRARGTIVNTKYKKKLFR